MDVVGSYEASEPECRVVSPDMPHKLVKVVSALDVWVFLFVHPRTRPDNVVPVAPTITTHRALEVGEVGDADWSP